MNAWRTSVAFACWVFSEAQTLFVKNIKDSASAWTRQAKFTHLVMMFSHSNAVDKTLFQENLNGMCPETFARYCCEVV
ncbi:hypothetical protein D3C76_1676880 [compost metagenome]